MIKTIPQAIDDMAVSLGASPSAEIPTVAQALENVYSALGGDRTDLDTLVVSEIIDLVAPLIQGGGGGGGDFTVTLQTVNMSAHTLTGQYNEEYGVYYASVKIADLDESIVEGVPYDEEFNYSIFVKSPNGMFEPSLPYKTIDGVEIFISQNVNELLLEGMAETEFTVSVPADTIEFYRASSDAVEAFSNHALIGNR